MGLSALEFVNGALGNDFKKIEANNETRNLGLAQARRAEANAQSDQEIRNRSQKTQADYSDFLKNGGGLSSASTPASQTNSDDSARGLFSASTPSASVTPQPAASMGASTPAFSADVPSSFPGVGTTSTSTTQPAQQPAQSVSPSVGTSLQPQPAPATAQKTPQGSQAVPVSAPLAEAPSQSARLWQLREIARKNGDATTFDKATQDYTAAINAEKNNAADRALSALMTGDTAPAVAVYNKYVHDGLHVTDTKANPDGSYTFTRSDGPPVKMTRDEVGSLLAGVKNGSFYDQLLQKRIEGMDKADANIHEAGGKLPIEQQLENTKTDNKIREAGATGQAGKNAADAASSRAQAGLHAAQEELLKSGNGGLTLPQQRSNAEIEAARNAIAGLTPDEIAHRTARTTNTGRENPEFSEGLAKQVTLAARRKVGSDDQFDQQSTDGSSQVVLAGKPIGNWSDEQLQKVYGSASAAGKAKIDAEVMGRLFSKDSSMAGNTLGKQTPNGFEVIDKTGKLIGHYAK